MAIIYSYESISNLAASDSLLITDVSDKNKTKTTTVGQLSNYINNGASQNEVVNITLTSAQLLALDGGGTIELIEAPGAGKVIVPISQALFLDFNTTAYNFDARIFLGFSSAANIETSFLNSTADKYIYSSVNTSDLTVNGAFNLYSTTQTVSTGDSPLTLSILYRIVDFS